MDIWMNGKFSANLEYIVVMWYSFQSLGNFVVVWYIFPILEYCAKKNMATLAESIPFGKLMKH
jgi:hypothetical protein